jgi:hypothetical protein
VLSFSTNVVVAIINLHVLSLQKDQLLFRVTAKESLIRHQILYQRPSSFRSWFVGMQVLALSLSNAVVAASLFCRASPSRIPESRVAAKSKGEYMIPKRTNSLMFDIRVK